MGFTMFLKYCTDYWLIRGEIRSTDTYELRNENPVLHFVLKIIIQLIKKKNIFEIIFEYLCPNRRDWTWTWTFMATLRIA